MKLKTTEKGFTLIELLVGIAIAAFVVGAASMTVITMMRLSPQTNNWAIALRQVQNAGYWISRDVQMAQGEITVEDENPTFLTLTVPEWDAVSEEVVDKTIDYEFANIDGEQWLVRTDSTGGQTAIAQYISEPIQNNYDLETRTLTFTIEATSVDKTVSRDYKAMQRVPTATP